MHQIGLAALSAAVFGLSAVPLELQRRIVNDAVKSGATRDHPVAGRRLCRRRAHRAGLKLALNVYRGWVAEDAVRTLRKTHRMPRTRTAGQPERCTDAKQAGVHIAMAVAEAEPIGGFVGTASPSRCCRAASW